MTRKDDEPIRALTHLIANEKDHEKITALADELGRLLTLENNPVPVSGFSVSEKMSRHATGIAEPCPEPPSVDLDGTRYPVDRCQARISLLARPHR
jgi:hypothetical protein